MKIFKDVLAVCLSMLLIIMAGCRASGVTETNAESTGKTVSSDDYMPQSRESSEALTNAAQPKFFLTVDASSGQGIYAISDDFHVLKSQDGKSWVNLLDISNYSAKSGKPALAALKSGFVFIAYYTSAGIETQKSVDAGSSWSKSSIKIPTDDPESGYGGSLALSFVNQADGYLLTSGLPAAGSMRKALYKTLNGGESWESAGNSLNSEKATADLTKIGGYTTGMAFFHSGTGFITCSYHGQNEISLYKTTNQGTTWSSIGIALPKSVILLKYSKDYYIDAYPPAIYGNDRIHAKLSLNICSNGAKIPYVYSSNDGGVTWMVNGKSNLFIKSYSFTDDKNGFGLDEYGTLYSTDNGGLTWIKT